MLIKPSSTSKWQARTTKKLITLIKNHFYINELKLVIRHAMAQHRSLCLNVIVLKWLMSGTLRGLYNNVWLAFQVVYFLNIGTRLIFLKLKDQSN